MRRPGPGQRVRHRFQTAVTAALAVTATMVEALRRTLAGRAPDRPDSYHRQVLDAEVSALARLRDASQIRDDLVASASHEFRTPLTAIRGSAITLLDRDGDLCPRDRQRLLTGIVQHADRLGRLLEDMLSAASAAALDRGAVTDVTAALGRFSLGRPRPPLRPRVAPRLAAYIDDVWLAQILDAMGEHLRGRADPDLPVQVTAGRTGGEVAIEVTYTPCRQFPGDPASVFEPFDAQDAAHRGRPASLAMYVARRLAEMHGGYVSADRSGDGRVTLTVLLRGAPVAGSG